MMFQFLVCSLNTDFNMSKVDPFWKEIIERKNQEILERFVKDLDSDDSLINRKYPTHPELPPLESKTAKYQIKYRTDETTPTKERHNFIVYDFDDRELGRARTIEEAYNVFLERYPQFDKNAIDAFITTIDK